jgi:hypothetical protein
MSVVLKILVEDDQIKYTKQKERRIIVSVAKLLVFING